MKRKLLYAFCTLLLLMSVLSVPVAAADTSKEFLFSLSVNGEDTVNVKSGDIITVTFRLERTDSSEAYMMNAMQNEIRYDSTFFQLVDGSVTLNSGIVSKDIALVDRYRELYMNFLSLSGGERWDASVLVGSFQLRVIADAGVTKITNEDYLVAVSGGEEVYASVCQDVTVVLSTDCVVSFESNGGSKIEDVITYFGERISEPQPSIREGYTLEGWYSDIHLQNRWDFESDVVQGNVTLYAKWIEGAESEVPPVTTEEEKDPENPPPVITEEEDESGFSWIAILVAAMLVILLILLSLLMFGKKTVRFNTCGGSPVNAQKVSRGGTVSMPMAPAKPAAEFDGWYTNRELTHKWNFEHDTVQKSLTLYAKWK